MDGASGSQHSEPLFTARPLCITDVGGGHTSQQLASMACRSSRGVRIGPGRGSGSRSDIVKIEGMPRAVRDKDHGAVAVEANTSDVVSGVTCAGERTKVSNCRHALSWGAEIKEFHGASRREERRRRQGLEIRRC